MAQQRKAHAGSEVAVAKEAPSGSGAWSVRLLLKGGPIIALFLLAGYLSAVSPHFRTTGNFMNVLAQTSVTAILAVGQTLVIISGGIDLSVAAMMALAGSVSAVSLAYWGWSVWLGLPLGLAVGTLVGLINGLVITKGRIPDFIATLGMMTTARGVSLLLTQGLPVPSHVTAIQLKAYLPPELIWLGSGAVLGVPVPALVAVATALLGWAVLHYSRLGRSALAVGGNREAARVSGINVDRTKIAVYAFCGFTAGIGGLVLTGRLNSANALMGDGMELQSIGAVVLGGTNLFGGEGTVIGTVVGALIMGVLGNGLNLLNVSAFWQRVVMGLVIIIVVVFDQWRRRRFGA
jgi:ribose transport system permease protein